MSIRDEMRLLVDDVFEKYPEMVASLEYRKTTGASSYDPASGQYTKAFTPFSLTGILSGYSEKELISGRIFSTDKCLRIRRTDYPQIPVAHTDTVMTGGKEHTIESFTTDPMGLFWKLQVREK